MLDQYPVVGYDANDPVDVIAAATACSKCQGAHARIFLPPPPPKQPAPLPSFPYHSHGATDGGEGPE